MKSRNDDFSPNTHPEENNISGKFGFRSAEGKYFQLELDFSPSSFLEVISKNCIRKPLQWQEYVKHTTDEQRKEYNNRAGHYIPAKNVSQIIASLVEEKITA